MVKIWIDKKKLTGTEISRNHNGHHQGKHEINRNIDVEGYKCEKGKYATIATSAFLKKNKNF